MEIEEGSARVSWYETQPLIGQNHIFHRLLMLWMVLLTQTPTKQNSNQGVWLIHSGFHEILLITSGVLVVIALFSVSSLDFDF